jgi:hypothetical protein
MVRPEGLAIVEAEAEGSLAGTVVERRYAGEATLYGVEIDAGGVVWIRAGVRSAAEGDRVGVAPAPGGPLPRAFPPGELAEEASEEDGSGEWEGENPS